LARASRSSRCSRSWRSLALIWSKVPYLSRAQSSSSCRQQTKTNERRAAKTNAKTTEQGRKQQANKHRRTWKTRHAGPPWIRSASFSARLSKVLWPRSSSHSCCSSWASVKWGAARRPAPAPAPGSPLGCSEQGGRGGTKKPRRHASSPRPPCGHPTFSRAPPPGAQGLEWAGLPTDPTRAAGRRRRGSPPPSPRSCRRGRAPAAPSRPPPAAPSWLRALAAPLRPMPPAAPQRPRAPDAPPQLTSPAVPP
jgi:hypothetical protein